jgi:hypothetical protein
VSCSVSDRICHPCQRPRRPTSRLGGKVVTKTDDRNFLPDAGRLIHTRAPVDIPHRLETGFWEGDEISSYYDPMVSHFPLLLMVDPKGMGQGEL